MKTFFFPLLGGIVLCAGAQVLQKPDLTKQPTLYAVGYAHLDTEWRWEYPQVIDEYIRKTMDDNFALIDKYPHYIFNFSGANRYWFMKEYFPADYERVKKYVAAGRWFPAGSSMEEGDVNAPSAEAILRQILYGNNWFRKESGKASAEYMLPDCFGFPASLPTILAHAGVKGFSTQKLVWGSSAPGGGPESREKTPEGTPFNVGIWAGPDGETVLAGLNPGAYDGDIDSDLSKPLPEAKPNAELEETRKKMQALRDRFRGAARPDEASIREFMGLREKEQGLEKAQQDRDLDRYQDDWAQRVENNGKVSGLFADYHYYGTGDVGGAPREESVKRLEAIVTQGKASFPPVGAVVMRDGEKHPEWSEVKAGTGPVQVLSANADQLFLDIPESARARLPRYTGEMELTNHSAGSLTSQAYQKRWLRKEELLADAAEKSSVAAEWLGARAYPLERLNEAWRLVMGGHFHDIAAGTATPKSYEYAWNDDVLAMNQFAGVFQSATQGVAASLNTQTKGVPMVVFNALNIEREDVVEATVTFPEGAPQAVRVLDAHGHEVPAQVSNGKVLFVAKVPPVGYAVYDVQTVSGASRSALRVTEKELENAFYLVKLNADGDIASIFDKRLNKEMLAGPARLAISYDNPKQWPAWNMDWEQEQAAPKSFVSGPAQVRIVENGAARVAVEVSREMAGSKFVQTISLAAGDAGQRVEVRNAVDWNTRESNLKAVFPLMATNPMATYNWDIGTVERPTAEPKKFEVPSHQWIDLTDLSQEFGVTILTDCKNGSGKPVDNTIRLTLIRTPGVSGGYPDQATQDIGHHEFVYGLASHANGWRDAQTDWQAQRLNAPLTAFRTAKHGGWLGRDFSLLRVSDPRVRVLAVKKAEASDELVVRLVELGGAPRHDVRISFAAPALAAREVNGQEQEVGPAVLRDGVLVTSFHAYQPRTFALKMGTAKRAATNAVSNPVALDYDTAAATSAGSAANGRGFDGKGNAYAAEMLPEQLTFDGIALHLGPAKTGAMNALTAKGQKISLPAGRLDRVYVLAAATDGDQKATFTVGDAKREVTVEDWGGFIGQWDDREWVAKENEVPARGDEPKRMERDDYAEMTGMKPGYIKRAPVAWFADHHHDSAGKNVPYAYSYLFAYAMDVPAGATSLTLPANDKIRVFAISAVEDTPAVEPAEPLYDTLGRSEPGAVVAWKAGGVASPQ